MNPIPELAPHLKQLRLSGILDSLDARNRQAIDAKLAYTEFLALLIQDEVARREQKKFTSRLRRAAFRTTKTLDQFDFDRLPKLNRALVHDLATGRYLTERAPVLIVGQVGVGKSHLAQALGHSAIRQGIDVLFTPCAQLTASLNAARAAGAYERRLVTLARVPLLIIDDFGLKPLRPPADEDLHDLIAERYEQAPTIVTSNLDSSNGTRLSPATGCSHRPLSTGYDTTRIASSSKALRVAIQKSPHRPANPPLPTPLNPHILKPAGMSVFPT